MSDSRFSKRLDEALDPRLAGPQVEKRGPDISWASCVRNSLSGVIGLAERIRERLAAIEEGEDPSLHHESILCNLESLTDVSNSLRDRVQNVDLGDKPEEDEDARSEGQDVRALGEAVDPSPLGSI